jgi:transketolase
VPEGVSSAYQQIAKKGADAERVWLELLEKYAKASPSKHAELVRRINGKLPADWERALPTYKPSDSPQASRKLSEIVLSALYSVLPELLGGSADLTGSNLTRVKGSVDFQPSSTNLGTYAGRYIRYGVREHGMGAIMNGISGPLCAVGERSAANNTSIRRTHSLQWYFPCE